MACHNKTESEGGLNLESDAQILKGGDSGPAIAAGDPSASELLVRIMDDSDPMPPEDNSVGAERFTESEVALIRRWIEEGAKPSEAMGESSFAWQGLPSSVRPIYALTHSSDGHRLVFGRGSSVMVQSLVRPESASQALLDTSLERKAAHRDIVQSVAVSPDGRWIASGGYRTLKLWQQPIAEEVVINELPQRSSLFTVSPDGKRLAFCVEQRKLAIADLDSGQVTTGSDAHGSDIACFAWSPTGSQLLSGDENGRIFVTDTVSLRSRECLAETNSRLRQAVGVASNRWLVLADDGTVHTIVVDETSGIDQASGMFERFGTTERVTCIGCLAGKDTVVVLARADGCVTMHHVDSANELARIEVGDQDVNLFASATSGMLTTVAANGTMKLWERSGKLVAELNEDYQEFLSRRSAERVARRKVAQVALLEKQVPELKSASEKEKEALKAVREARDTAEKELASADAELEKAAAEVGESEKALAAAIADQEDASKKVAAAKAAVAEQKKAAIAAEKKRDAAEQELGRRGKALHAAEDSAKRAEQRIEALVNEVEYSKADAESAEGRVAAAETASKSPSSVKKVAFIEDEQIAALGKDGIIRLFDAPTGRPLRNFAVADAVDVMSCERGLLVVTSTGLVKRRQPTDSWELSGVVGSAEATVFSDRVTAVDFSPDSKLIAVGSGPPSRFGDLKILDAETREIVYDFGEVHADTILCARFSPSGKSLITAAADKLARLFDVEKREEIRAFEGHTHHVSAVTWRDDRSAMATASADATIKIWRVSTGEQIRTIKGLKREATALAFVGDSNQLASASSDGLVRLYNADDGKLIRTFSGATDALYALSVSADEKRITAGGQSGEVWVWTIADGKLVRSE
ncbi:MAG: vegetatible incompatibility protein HET-E1 [Aureliella sp.]